MALFSFLLCAIVLVSVCSASAFVIILHGDKPSTASPFGRFFSHCGLQDIGGWECWRPERRRLLALTLETQLSQAGNGKFPSAWLFGIRACIFLYLLGVQIYAWWLLSWENFFFYSGWNFMLLVAFFGLGTYLSMEKWLSEDLRGTWWGNLLFPAPRFAPPVIELDEVEDKEVEPSEERGLCKQVESEDSTACVEAGSAGYLFQILFQICSTEVLLIDAVHWFVLYPIAVSDHEQHKVLNFISYHQHGVNLLAMVVEFSLNSLPFPMFRVAYVLLLSGTYVAMQWCLHYFFNFSWPYPFLETSTPEAPVWYAGLLAFQFLCFYLSAFASKLKYKYLAKASSLLGERER